MDFEKLLSIELYLTKTPVLISSQFLRRYSCGQVDLAYAEEGKLYLIELKSTQTGVMASQQKQVARLHRSCALLQSFLGIPTYLKFIAKSSYSL